MTIDEWFTPGQDGRPAPERVAFEFEGEAITYGEFDRRIDRMALALAGAGVAPGDRVGFCGLNSVHVFDTLFACARLGAIFLPLNNRLTATELGHQLSDAEPAIVLTTDGFAATLEAASPDVRVWDLDRGPTPSTSEQATADADDEPAPVAVEADDTLLVVYTSGTTGSAKGAMLSHGAVEATVANGIDHQDLGPHDRTLALLPTFHVGGLNIQVLPTLRVGGTVVLHRRFDAGEALRAFEHDRITQVVLVPATLRAIAGHPDFASTDLSSLRGINSGSSIVPAATMAPFFDRGVPVGQVYGSTETGPTSIVLDFPDAAAHVGSCGRAATHTQVRVVDAQGMDVTADQVGEIWLRGPNVFSGYWRNPVATRAAFAPDGWFRTGDLGSCDADGYVTISDRMTDVVISGGENVYPAEIEPVLAQHPAIAEVSVIGRPHERWVEVPVAVVVMNPGAELSIEELRSWCDDRMARFKQPRELVIVDELPKTALGKVQKHELRAQLR